MLKRFLIILSSKPYLNFVHLNNIFGIPSKQQHYNAMNMDSLPVKIRVIHFIIKINLILIENKLIGNQME